MGVFEGGVVPEDWIDRGDAFMFGSGRIVRVL